MPSMKGFFVRGVTDDAIIAVRAKFPSAELDSNAEFIRVLNATLRKQDLMELSLCLETDVMWLSYHSITDYLEYYHWQAGKLLRGLGNGIYEERTWDLVQGQAEAWERQYFFSPEDLASLLDDEDDEEEDRLSVEEKQRRTQFWQAGELRTGENLPNLIAQRCAFHIASYYRFPGWNSERV